MVITVRCTQCKNIKKINVTTEQYEELKKPRSQRRAIQEILPDHTPEEREMLISGLCNDCFESLFL